MRHVRLLYRKPSERVKTTPPIVTLAALIRGETKTQRRKDAKTQRRKGRAKRIKVKRLQKGPGYMMSYPGPFLHSVHYPNLCASFASLRLCVFVS
jgi:hypothetical protein